MMKKIWKSYERKNYLLPNMRSFTLTLYLNTTHILNYTISEQNNGLVTYIPCDNYL